MGGKGSGRRSKEDNLIRAQLQRQTPIADIPNTDDNMFLPNLSGISSHPEFKSNTYWSRSGTTLSPKTSGDNIDVGGDANVDGDLTIDTNTLHVDSTNNRVGIGTITPSTILNINGGNIKVDGGDIRLDHEKFYRCEDSGGTSRSVMGCDKISGDEVIRFGSGNMTGIHFISSTGGTSTPAMMHTNGDLFFQGDGTGLPYGEISVVSNTTETTITTAGTAVQVAVFDTNGLSNLTTPDPTNDHITIDQAGVYMVHVSMTLNSVGGAGSLAEITCKKNNGASEIICHMDRTLAGGGSESGVIHLSGIADLAANDTIEVWIENETNTQNYVVEDCCLSLFQIGGT